MRYSEWVALHRDTPVLDMSVARACRENAPRAWLASMRAHMRTGEWPETATVGDLAHLILDGSDRKFFYRERDVRRSKSESWWLECADLDPRGEWVLSLSSARRNSIANRLDAYPDAPTIRQLFRHTSSRPRKFVVSANERPCTYAEWVAATPKLNWLTAHDMLPLCPYTVPGKWSARRQKEMNARMPPIVDGPYIHLIHVMRCKTAELAEIRGVPVFEIENARAYWREKWCKFSPASRERFRVLLDPQDLSAADLLALSLTDLRRVCHVSTRRIEQAFNAAHEVRARAKLIA